MSTKEVVIYDTVNKDLIASVLCGDDELAQYLSKPNRDYVEHPLIPKNSYFIDPETLEMRRIPDKPGDGYEFDRTVGQWVFVLGDAKKEKWAEIKCIRNEKECGVLTYLGYVFDINEASQRRIQGAVQFAVLNPDATFDWTLADNTTVLLDSTQLLGLGTTLGEHVNMCHATARTLRAQIESATTETELTAVTWPE